VNADDEIVVYCHQASAAPPSPTTCASSASRNVKNLAGGLDHWPGRSIPRCAVLVPPPVTIRREADGLCTLDRPPLNLLEPTIIRTLRNLSSAGRRPHGAPAVITGNGRAFTAG